MGAARGSASRHHVFISWAPVEGPADGERTRASPASRQGRRDLGRARMAGWSLLGVAPYAGGPECRLGAGLRAAAGFRRIGRGPEVARMAGAGLRTGLGAGLGSGGRTKPGADLERN